MSASIVKVAHKTHKRMGKKVGAKFAFTACGKRVDENVKTVRHWHMHDPKDTVTCEVCFRSDKRPQKHGSNTVHFEHPNQTQTFCGIYYDEHPNQFINPSPFTSSTTIKSTKRKFRVTCKNCLARFPKPKPI